jgi:hypothetical protein
MQNAVVTTGNGTVLDVSGMGTAICQVSGTFVGTIVFEGSIDNSVFNPIDSQNISGGLITSIVNSIGFYKIPCNGIKYIRARISSYTSGAITVKGYADALSCSNNAFQISGSNLLIEANVTLTGSAQQLATATCKSVTIQAEPANIGYVYVGRTNGVSSTVHSFTLSPGSSVKIGCSNANLVYVIGTSGDKVCYGGEA